LNEADRHSILDMIEKTARKKGPLLKYLEIYTKRGTVLGQDHYQAFKEVIDKLREFAKTHEGSEDWTLQDLCFHVIPEYKQQWEQIGDRLPPEEKALLIGYNSMEEIEKMLSKRGGRKK
jgi:hypothetical protein